MTNNERGSRLYEIAKTHLERDFLEPLPDRDLERDFLEPAEPLRRDPLLWRISLIISISRQVCTIVYLERERLREPLPDRDPEPLEDPDRLL